MKYVRNVLATLGLLLMFLYPISSPVQAAEVEWNQFRENSANNPVLENDQLEKNLRNKIETKNEVRSTPVIIEDRIFVGNHDTGELSAFDLETGDLLWESSLGKGRMIPHNKSGAPMLYEDRVYVGSPITQKFYSFDAESGDEVWRYNGYINKAPPVADDGVVYFSDTRGLVYGFDPESGDLIGKKRLGGKLSPSGPVLVNDHLVIGSQDHHVYIEPTEEILEADDKPEEGEE